MSKGITVACANEKCRKILLRYANFKGEGSFELKCLHCSQLCEVKLKQVPVIDVVKISVIALMFILTLGIWLIELHTYETPTMACIDFR